ncbi:MAG: hypothetical protein IPJ95_10445 [Gemmatimonadetes bacterium]|nr:hypothetical protein [Gemmatimonadota bacterium]MBK7924031.1 hypothetical protein [Gemmatimonadota bacterium]
MLGLRGFPYYGSSLVSNAPAWELPLAAAHLPGIALLTATGQCCGFRNGRVLGPRIVAGHIRLSAAGLALLALANWGAWLAIGAAGALALRRRAAAPAAAGALPPSDLADR